METNAAGGSPIKTLTRPFLLLGVGLIVLGALSIYAPQQSGMAVGILVGVYLMLSGLARTAVFWVATSWGSAILRLVLGGLAVFAGGMMIADPALGLRVITIVAIAVRSQARAVRSCWRPPPIESCGRWSVRSSSFTAGR